MLFLLLLFFLSSSSSDHDNEAVEEIEMKYLINESLRGWSNINTPPGNGNRCLDNNECTLFRVHRHLNEWWISYESIDVVSVLKPSRPEAMKLMLIMLHYMYGSEIPDCLDFIINTDDGRTNTGAGPVLGFASHHRKMKMIAVPDFTFVSFPETYQYVSYPSLYESLLRMAEVPKYDHVNKAVFIGNVEQPARASWMKKKTFLSMCCIRTFAWRITMRLFVNDSHHSPKFASTVTYFT